MLKPAVILLAVASFTLSACGKPWVKRDQQPQTTHSQYKVLTWNDWNLLGQRSSARIVSDLAAMPDFGVSPVVEASSTDSKTKEIVSYSSPKPFYVQPGPFDMPFSRAFKRILENELLATGVPVVSSPKGAIIVNYQVQSFFYDDEGYRLPASPESVFGLATAIGIKEYGNWGTLSTIGAGLVATELVRGLIDFGAVTDAEMVLTTSIAHGAELVHQKSEVLYVRPEELSLYMTSLPADRPVRATATGTEEKLPVQTIAIVTQ
ncbi:hypothetical protein [Kiloniella majae]|uniref:hypothetical protein n=1 Tax=Kiloniella majae TaxID=1938558 RepID=UPI000A278566|nr:hypothetical protein [Kiloniella majae]